MFSLSISVGPFESYIDLFLTEKGQSLDTKPKLKDTLKLYLVTDWSQEKISDFRKVSCSTVKNQTEEIRNLFGWKNRYSAQIEFINFLIRKTNSDEIDDITESEPPQNLSTV